MSFYLRRIDKKPLWYKYLDLDPQPAWLTGTDIPADLLLDFKTTIPEKSNIENELSVYLIEDDKSNLNITLAALASNRDQLQKFDFVLIEEQELSNRGFNIITTIGDTPSKDVNEQYHKNLNELTANKVSEFGSIIYYNYKIERKGLDEIKEMIISGIDNNLLDKSKIKPKLLKKLGYSA